MVIELKLPRELSGYGVTGGYRNRCYLEASEIGSVLDPPFEFDIDHFF